MPEDAFAKKTVPLSTDALLVFELETFLWAGEIKGPCRNANSQRVKLMHFYSGLLMYFCSGVDKFATDTTAEWIAGQVTEAFPWDGTPRHLIRDRDGAFGPAYALRIRAMGIRDHPVAARSSWQNGHVERLIGSIRRESLDNLMVSGEAQLRRILKSYAAYSNEVGPLLSLGKDAPNFRRCETVGDLVAMPILGGLHHRYVRA